MKRFRKPYNDQMGLLFTKFLAQYSERADSAAATAVVMMVLSCIIESSLSAQVD